MNDREDAGLDPRAEVLQTIGPEDPVCGNCVMWRPAARDAQGRWSGPCRLQPGRGNLPATAQRCERFLKRGGPIPSAPPPEPSRRRSRTLSGPILRRGGAVVGTVPAASAPSPLPRHRPDEEIGELSDMTRSELIEIIREALGEGEMPALANKWEGGSVVLKPANPELQSREIPIDSLFHKVVMIRDRLRVLEAKLNAHPRLTDAEKVELQSYITKCYGSLTTFNVLFREKADQFVGERSREG